MIIFCCVIFNLKLFHNVHIQIKCFIPCMISVSALCLEGLVKMALVQIIVTMIVDMCPCLGTATKII